MKHSMKLLESPFHRIKTGNKKIELRLFDEKRQEVKVGDTIEFSKLPDLKEKLEVEVMELYQYPSFKELIENIGMKEFGYPKNHSIEKFLFNLRKIYPTFKEKKYGVLGIKIKLRI